MLRPVQGEQNTMPRKAAILLLLLSLLQAALGQSGQPSITNSDIINMANAGIGDQTIVMTIQRGPTNFDTSPQSLIALKKAGLSDQVLNAVIAASNLDVATKAKKAAKTSPGSQSPATHIHEDRRAGDTSALFQMALDAVGPKAKVLGVQSTRSISTYMVSTSSGTSKSYDSEVTKVYPDKMATIFKTSAGAIIKEVVTQEFGYSSSGDAKAFLGDRVVANYQQNLKLEPIYVAQH